MDCLRHVSGREQGLMADVCCSEGLSNNSVVSGADIPTDGPSEEYRLPAESDEKYG